MRILCRTAAGDIYNKISICITKSFGIGCAFSWARKSASVVKSSAAGGGSSVAVVCVLICSVFEVSLLREPALLSFYSFIIFMTISCWATGSVGMSSE